MLSATLILIVLTFPDGSRDLDCEQADDFGRGSSQVSRQLLPVPRPGGDEGVPSGLQAVERVHHGRRLEVKEKLGQREAGPQVGPQVQGAPEQMQHIAICGLNLCQASNLTFSHVFWNENLEPVSSGQK